MSASEPSRTSTVRVVVGLLVIATAVAAAGLWTRGYTRDRREMWLVNPTGPTARIYLGEASYTVVKGEVLPATAPREPTFEVEIRQGERRERISIERHPGEQEVLLLDLEPAAKYVVLDLTPKFAANGTEAKRRVNVDGLSFRPDVVTVATATTTVVRLPGGAGATIGPLEGLPGAVWLARRYGSSVYKVFRVRPKVDAGALRLDVERALADQRPLPALEWPLTETSTAGS